MVSTRSRIHRRHTAGAAIDPTNAANAEAIAANIRGSFEAFEDNDHDGVDDDHEGPDSSPEP